MCFKQNDVDFINRIVQLNNLLRAALKGHDWAFIPVNVWIVVYSMIKSTVLVADCGSLCAY